MFNEEYIDPFAYNEKLMKLSAVLIVKNEEKHLDKCLQSIKGVDEIIIADTGSTDGTVAIARKYTDKIFLNYKWNDNFAEARNYALSKARGEWIISIDADEWLETPIDKVREWIEKYADKKLVDVNLRANGSRETNRFPRIFKRCPEVFWKGKAHNYLSLNEVNPTDIVIVYSYSYAHQLDPDRTLRILKKAVAEEPELSREKFYLAREYWYRKEYINAIAWYDEYLKTAHWKPEICEALLVKARCKEKLGRVEEAKNDCLSVIKINPDFKEALEYMAELTKEERWKDFSKLATNKEVLFIR